MSRCGRRCRRVACIPLSRSKAAPAWGSANRLSTIATRNAVCGALSASRLADLRSPALDRRMNRDGWVRSSLLIAVLLVLAVVFAQVAEAAKCPDRLGCPAYSASRLSAWPARAIFGKARACPNTSPHAMKRRPRRFTGDRMCECSAQNISKKGAGRSRRGC
jgi:hypothetical protein